MKIMKNSKNNTKKSQYCQRCKNHGILVTRRGHTGQCPFNTELHNATCHRCHLIMERGKCNKQLKFEELINIEEVDDNDEKEGIVNNKRKQSCAQCTAHGEPSILKGHKMNCPWRGCKCHLCSAVNKRRAIMAQQMWLRRDQDRRLVNTTDRSISSCSSGSSRCTSSSNNEDNVMTPAAAADVTVPESATNNTKPPPALRKPVPVKPSTDLYPYDAAAMTKFLTQIKQEPDVSDAMRHQLFAHHLLTGAFTSTPLASSLLTLPVPINPAPAPSLPLTAAIGPLQLIPTPFFPFMLPLANGRL